MRAHITPTRDAPNIGRLLVIALGSVSLRPRLPIIPPLKLLDCVHKSNSETD